MDVLKFERCVLFIEQEIPHYRAGVLAAIARSIKAEFHFFHGRTSDAQAFIRAETRDLPPDTSQVYVHWFWGERLVLHNYWGALFHAKSKGCIIVLRHNPRSVWILPFMFWCRLSGRRVIIWGQGFSRKRPFRPARHPLDMLNLMIVKASHAYVAYTDEIRQRLSSYVKEEKLFTAYNTLDLSGLVAIRDDLESEGKAAVRRRLQLPASRYLVFIGRLQPRKQAETFVRTLSRLQSEFHMDVGGIIIGKGSEESRLKSVAADLSVANLHFTGAIGQTEAAHYLFAADLLLIPGWLGLAVNHAFFFGLPVVSQKWGEDLNNHGPEAAYVIEGYNGCFSDARNGDALVSVVRTVLDNCAKMGRNARDYFDANLDLSGMVEGFRRAIDYVQPPKVICGCDPGDFAAANSSRNMGSQPQKT